MAKLYLVRHGQASFGLGNYDKLSKKGISQCAYIPQHFTGKIDALYCGSLLRHRQTVQHGFNNRQPVIIPGLNEFNHENILKVYRPELANKVRALWLLMRQNNPRRFMETEFNRAITQWMSAEEKLPYEEPFHVFGERCQAALKEIVANARREKHKEVVAVTSGGFISYIITHVLGLPHQKMIDLSLSVINTSVTGFLFNDEKVSLSYFNNYSHLPKEITTFI